MEESFTCTLLLTLAVDLDSLSHYSEIPSSFWSLFLLSPGLFQLCYTLSFSFFNINTIELRLVIRKYQVQKSEGLPGLILASIHKSLEEFWMLGFNKCLKTKMSKMGATSRWLFYLKEHPVSKLQKIKCPQSDITMTQPVWIVSPVRGGWCRTVHSSRAERVFWAVCTGPPSRKGEKEFVLQAVRLPLAPLPLFLRKPLWQSHKPS